MAKRRRISSLARGLRILRDDAKDTGRFNRRISAESWERARTRKNAVVRLPGKLLINVALTLACLAALALGARAIRMSRNDGRPPAGVSQNPPSDSGKTPASTPPETPELRSNAAINTLRHFFRLPDHRARAALCSDLDGAEAKLRDYYDSRGNPMVRRILNPSVTAVSVDDREILLVSFEDQDGRFWAAPMEWAGNGYRLHWQAMTAYGEMPWTKFLKERPADGAVFRVKIYLREGAEPDPFFPEDVPVLISHPELAQPITALLPITSEAHERMTSFPPSTEIPATVTLTWRPEEPIRPVLSDWHHRDWIR